jgi:hypothetical protein
MISDEIRELETKDPTVLRVFVAEYAFMKGDMEKAYALFSEVFEDKGLSPVMRDTVRSYLVFASKKIREKEIDNIDFTISFSCEGKEGVDYRHYKITKATIQDQLTPVGMILEILDYYLKKQKEGD